MTALVRAADNALWKVPAEETVLDPQAFAQGLVILASNYGKAFDEAAFTAYHLAVADVRTEDFAVGVRLVLQTTKFLTAAALYEACEDARRSRLDAADAARQAEERRQGEAEDAAAEQRRLEREARIPQLLAAGDRAEALRLALLNRGGFVAWASMVVGVEAGHIRIAVSKEGAGVLSLCNGATVVAGVARQLFGEDLTVEVVVIDVTEPKEIA